jgi:hypothetical protein
MRDEVTGGWKKLHNKEHHNNKTLLKVTYSKCMRWTGHVAQEVRIAYKSLIGTRAEKRTFGCPRRRNEDDIKLELK